MDFPGFGMPKKKISHPFGTEDAPKLSRFASLRLKMSTQGGSWVEKELNPAAGALGMRCNKGNEIPGSLQS